MEFFVKNLANAMPGLVPVVYGPYPSKDAAIDAITKLRIPGTYQVYGGTPVEGGKVTIGEPVVTVE